MVSGTKVYLYCMRYKGNRRTKIQVIKNLGGETEEGRNEVNLYISNQGFYRPYFKIQLSKTVLRIREIIIRKQNEAEMPANDCLREV